MTRGRPPDRPLLPIHTQAALPHRKLTAETVKRWGVGLASAKDGDVLVFPYRNDKGQPVAQKCRTREKDFFVTGDLGEALLFGQHLWRTGGRRVIVTEGEIDAMSIDQALDYRWTVVSIPNGASGARKSLAKHVEWLNSFETVVLAFDNDEPGRKATDECVGLFPPGKVAIMQLPLKDASDMMQADRVDELVKAVWEAPAYRPDGIVSIADILDKVLSPPIMGLAWCLPKLTSVTFGRHMGQLVMFGAGTGIGKTTFMLQQAGYDLTELNEPVGIFAFEMAPAIAVKRIAGQLAGKLFHKPDGSWTPEELQAQVTRLQNGAPLYLYDHYGACDWDVVRERIRYLRHTHGVRIFYIDNLTALAESGDKERGSLEEITKQMGGLVQELDCWIFCISHLTTPEGKSHEEGGRVMIKNFKGSRAIGFWAHYMFALERDQQGDDPEKKITTFRVLKDRDLGESTGETFQIDYDKKTGRYYEVDPTGATFDAVQSPF